MPPLGEKSCEKLSLSFHGGLRFVYLFKKKKENCAHVEMDSELLQSFVRSGPSVGEEEGEPSRLYSPQKELKEKKKQKMSSSGSSSSLWSRRKNVVIIEQRKGAKTLALALDECYCDKDRAASCSFGYMDIKHELKQKHTTDRLKLRSVPDGDSDIVAFMMLGMREIKSGNTESGTNFLNKVSSATLPPKRCSILFVTN
jgi:hypothetical protein